MSDLHYVLFVFGTFGAAVILSCYTGVIGIMELYASNKRQAKEAAARWIKEAEAAKAKGREPKPFVQKVWPFTWSYRLIALTGTSISLWFTLVSVGLHYR